MNPEPEQATRAQQLRKIAERFDVDPECLAIALDAELSRRGEERRERREQRMARPPAPERGRHAAITSGRYAPVKKPQSAASDRQYVAGALKHWRAINRLTVREASARVGYSPTSSSWSSWERGVSAPPYRVLLRILAATGLGSWIDADLARSGDPDVVLEELRQREDEDRLARDRRRAALADRPLRTMASGGVDPLGPVAVE